ESLVLAPVGFGHAPMSRVHPIAARARVEPPALVERLVIGGAPLQVAEQVPQQGRAGAEPGGNDDDVRALRGLLPPRTRGSQVGAWAGYRNSGRGSTNPLRAWTASPRASSVFDSFLRKEKKARRRGARNQPRGLIRSCKGTVPLNSIITSHGSARVSRMIPGC